MTLLRLAFLFFVGSGIGWCGEVLFRHYCCPDTNPERKWINPGFLTGPYLPLYGFGLILCWLLCSWQPFDLPRWLNDGFHIVVMMVAMTLLEYIAGIIFIKGMKVQLWDYTDCWGNIQGIICPLFTLIWGACGALYYYLIHPHVEHALAWFGYNLAFSFVVGFFFGVFTLDLVYSTRLVYKIRAFAKENDLVVRYEEFKANIRSRNEQIKSRLHLRFVFAFRSEETLVEHLERYRETYRARQEKLRRKLEERKRK